MKRRLLFFMLLLLSLNVSAEEQRFFYIEFHENSFSLTYSPDFLKKYMIHLGEDFKIVEHPPLKLVLKSRFYFNGDQIITPGWESGAVTSYDFEVKHKGVKQQCHATAVINIIPFVEGISWVLFEVKIKGPLTVLYNYGIAVRQVAIKGKKLLGITGDVMGELTTNQLFFVLK